MSDKNIIKETAVRTDSLSTGAVKLERKITLLNGITVIVGSIIGSGIFVSPKGVLQQVGSVGVSLGVWLACGLFSMIGAYCYTELGTCILKSGADYAYIGEAFGPLPAFLRLWVECMIVRPCSTAVVALTFANNVIEPLFPECDQPEQAVRLLAALCIAILSVVNALDVKWAMRVQDVFTYAKLLALVLIIITGFIQLIMGETEHFERPLEGTTIGIGPLAIAFYQGLFAYNGWNYLNYVIEELKDPYRNLPIASWSSCILVTVVYFLANVAYFSVISPKDILASEAVAVTFAQRMYGVMAWVMPVFVALSTFGGVNGILFTTSRLFYVGSREGHMPQVLSYVQIKRLTPAPAVIFMGLFSCVYLISTDMYKLINYVSFVNWLAIALSIVSLIYFRYARPDMTRPIKVWIGWPIIYVLCSLFIILVPLFTTPVETGLGCLIISSGIPFYILFVKWKSKPKKFNKFVDSVTVFIQKLLLVVPEDPTKEL